MQERNIYDPVMYIPGVGLKRAEMLDRLGVKTVRDLLYFFPRKYHDRRNLVPIAKVEPGSHATVIGDVVGVNLHRRGRGRGVLTVKVRDESGEMKAVWFNQNYLQEKFTSGDTVMLWGEVRFYNGLEMMSPGFEHVGTDEHGGAALAEEMSHLVPVYPLTEGLSQGQIRPLVHAALDAYAPFVPELLPESIRAREGFLPVSLAIKNAHFPETVESKEAAKRRLVHEEFLVFELAIALRRNLVKNASGIAFRVTDECDEHIRKLFPFEFTGGQESAIEEIVRDMQSKTPMNRLLQGDVGCGKTVVALYAMLAAVADKYQAAIMAPTEILAEQHYRTITNYLCNSKVRVKLLTGSSDRKEAIAEIERGDADIIIGTHAVIQHDVRFKRLGLVVIDEQHKFGVLQRAKLRWKGFSPDVLVMTATPIPRTLALTLWGDLDISTIRELPPGRRPIVTRQTGEKHLPEAYDFIRKEVEAGRQAYIVCPMIEQSEALDVSAAVDVAGEVREKYFSGISVGLMHGRMPAEEKDAAMAAFVSGKTKVLVSTIVVEVGIDVPNAAVMLILHAERFGLAQLHQLRGRIGRGAEESACILVSDPVSEDAKARLKIMCDTLDGFRIAEEDLKLRGTGELLGTRQSGLPDLKIANLFDDIAVLEKARDDAKMILTIDPQLKKPEHEPLRQRLSECYDGKLELFDIG